jgi:phage gp16-like protein
MLLTHKDYYRILPVAKREIGMEEDAYRALLARLGAKEKAGKISASTLALKDLRAVYEEFLRLGFKPKHTNKAEDSNPESITPKQRHMIQRICQQLDLNDEQLSAFIKRTAKVDSVQFLNRSLASRVISGLERWETQRDKKPKGKGRAD